MNTETYVRLFGFLFCLLLSIPNEASAGTTYRLRNYATGQYLSLGAAVGSNASQVGCTSSNAALILSELTK